LQEITSMSRKYLLSFCILFLFTRHVFGQTVPLEIANKFFSTYNNVGPSNAIDSLFTTNVYAADFKKEVDALKNKIQENLSSIGKFTGYQLLETKSAGKDLILLVFIAKHERLPLIFKMLFYKPLDKWEIQDLSFDNNVDEVLREAK